MQCYLEFLLDIWPSTIWPMRIAVLITTAEAFDNILFVLLHMQERAYYYACVYTSAVAELGGGGGGGGAGGAWPPLRFQLVQ